MANRIAEEIVARLSQHFTPSYIYTEQDELPYCVYEIAQQTPLYCKSGVYGYRADVTVYLAAASEQQSVEMKDQALAVLSERKAGWVVNITSVQPAFAEDQWLQKIDFTITQL